MNNDPQAFRELAQDRSAAEDNARWESGEIDEIEEELKKKYEDRAV